MSTWLDQLTNSTDVFKESIDEITRQRACKEEEDEYWKNTVYTTVCIPEIDHIHVTSKITKTQEEQDKRTLSCGGQTMRSRILCEVENSLAGLRAVEKRILKNASKSSCRGRKGRPNRML